MKIFFRYRINTYFKENLILSDGWRDVQEVQVRDGDLGGTQRLRDEEGQDVHRQGAHEGHYPGDKISIKILWRRILNSQFVQNLSVELQCENANELNEDKFKAEVDKAGGAK